MGTFHHHAFSLKMNPPPPKDTQAAVSFSPVPLLERGLSLPVEISTASIFRNLSLNIPLSSIAVTALFDTGATFTAIDINLARHLKLFAIGQSAHDTAAGRQTMPNFAVDISFPGTGLSPFHNLRVGSCKLGFILANNTELPQPQNLGVLIGRDIMSRWSIVWHGVTSTVFVSD
jgi:hypothetical protein